MTTHIHRCNAQLSVSLNEGEASHAGAGEGKNGIIHNV